jgi:hypothetical protein
MKKLILTFGLVLATQLGMAQDDAFKKDVLKVVERSGTTSQIKAAKSQILTMIPEAKQAAFIVEFDALLPKIYETLTKTYMEVYTKEDIKAMLAFYDSPVGKKMTEKEGVISEKSAAASQELNGELQTLVMKYMQ